MICLNDGVFLFICCLIFMISYWSSEQIHRNKMKHLKPTTKCPNVCEKQNKIIKVIEREVSSSDNNINERRNKRVFHDEFVAPSIPKFPFLQKTIIANLALP